MPSSTYPATHRSGSNSLSGGFSAVCPLVNWIKVVVLIMKRSSSENRNAHRKKTAEGFRRKPQNCNNILWLPRERVWARRWLAEWRLKELVDSWLNVYNQITRYAGFLVVSEGTTCTACTAGSVCSFSGTRGSFSGMVARRFKYLRQIFSKFIWNKNLRFVALQQAEKFHFCVLVWLAEYTLRSPFGE